MKQTSNKLSTDGKIIEAFSYDIQLIHKILQQNINIHDAFQEISHILIWRNQNAMALLQQGKKKEAKRLLLLIEKVLDNLNMPQLSNLQNLVYNNISCCLKRYIDNSGEGNLESAIKYLEKGIELTHSMKDEDNEALYHLNICVILSQLEKYHTYPAIKKQRTKPKKA